MDNSNGAAEGQAAVASGMFYRIFDFSLSILPSMTNVPYP